jgi:xanthine dehydrogenase YagR molybdenum-binding subunit
VGGGFGSKGNAHANVILAAMAARALPGRPVKLALTRQQMFFLAGYRTPTIQRLQLAADNTGRLTAIAIDVIEQTSKIKEFAEQTGVATRMMYAAPSRRTTHRLAALDVPVPSWMRAPGEAPGMFGPEVALDELAGQLGIDPVELRIRNEPAADPETGKPWSSRPLVECLRESARRFGWHDRDPRPGVRRPAGRRVADRQWCRLLGLPDHADAAVGRHDPVLRRPLHRGDRRRRPRHRRLDSAAADRRRRARCAGRRRRRADR